MAIDPQKLLQRIAVDNSFLTRTRRDCAEETAGLCRELWTEMLSRRTSVIIPAPALAEYLRPPPHTAPPRVPGVEIVAFDELAALRVATEFPPTAFRQFRDSLGLDGAVVKFDAMIVACALRHRAQCLVTLDDGQRKIAEAVGLAVRSPVDFLAVADQHELFPPVISTPPDPEDSA